MSRFMDHPDFDEEYPEEFFDAPDEFPKDELEAQKLKALEEVEAMEIPDVYWAEDIAKIENPEIKAKEIKVAENIVEQEKKLNADRDAGEISEYKHWETREFDINKAKSNASSRCSLATVGLTYDHLGDVAEDWDLLTADATHDFDLSGKKDRIKNLIDLQGPEKSLEKAKEMREAGRLSKEAYEMIARQTRLNGK